MDTLETATSTSKGFLNHMTSYSNDEKNEVMNLVQYAILSIIPVVFINKAVHRVFPGLDDTKGNLEILAEVVGQVTAVVLGVFIVHRIVCYVPMYSGAAIEKPNFVTMIIPLLIVLMSFKTKIGEKVTLLMDRLISYIDDDAGTVKVVAEAKQEGISNQGQQSPQQHAPQQQHAPALDAPPMNRGDFVDTQHGMMTQQAPLPTGQQQVQQQQQQQFSSMQGPMAFGGSSFGAPF